MIVDFDDFHEHNHRLDLLYQLKQANPKFKCTMFAIPGMGGWRFWLDTPPWIELAVHGWRHPSPHECEQWDRERMLQLMDEPIVRRFFVNGFKAPGWQISDGCYEALVERGWWIADQPYNDHRRPAGLPVHRLGDGDHWHGHIQDVCGNGLVETWPQLLETVRAADGFRFVSETVECWTP